MTAIDLNRGEHAWMQPNGNGNRYRHNPLLRDLDLPPLGGDGAGGPLVTKTLLVSGLNAGGAGDGPRLIARDKATGEILGSVDLPGRPIGTPMTYLHPGPAVHRPHGRRRGARAGRPGAAVVSLVARATPQHSHGQGPGNFGSPRR